MVEDVAVETVAMVSLPDPDEVEACPLPLLLVLLLLVLLLLLLSRMNLPERRHDFRLGDDIDGEAAFCRGVYCK